MSQTCTPDTPRPRRRATDLRKLIADHARLRHTQEGLEMRRPITKAAVDRVNRLDDRLEKLRQRIAGCPVGTADEWREYLDFCSRVLADGTRPTPDDAPLFLRLLQLIIEDEPPEQRRPVLRLVE